MVEECRITSGLLDALLDLAATREPESVSALLAVTPAGDLDGAIGADGGGRTNDPTGAGDDAGSTDEHGTRVASGNGTAQQGSVPVTDVDPGAPVFTDVYLPAEGRSVDAVFGMDVSVPHGQGQGRFVSHPLGELSVSTGDDLHEVVLVAVPPWRRGDVAAFDRSGRRLALDIVAAAPPERRFEG